MLKVVTRATENPISIEDAKDQLSITDNEDDLRIDRLIKAATEYVESATRRAVMSQTWDELLPEFPTETIQLKKPPLQSLTSVSYYAVGGSTLTVLPSTDYWSIAPTHQPGQVTTRSAFPAAEMRPDAIAVRYVCGYPNRDSVPEGIKHAIRLLVGHWNENREAEITGTITAELKIGLKSLLGQAGWGVYA